MPLRQRLAIFLWSLIAELFIDQLFFVSFHRIFFFFWSNKLKNVSCQNSIWPRLNQVPPLVKPSHTQCFFLFFLSDTLKKQLNLIQRKGRISPVFAAPDWQRFNQRLQCDFYWSIFYINFNQKHSNQPCSVHAKVVPLRAPPAGLEHMCWVASLIWFAVYLFIKFAVLSYFVFFFTFFELAFVNFTHLVCRIPLQK